MTYSINVQNSKKILYLQPYSEASVVVDEFDKDPISERFTLPSKYKIEVPDPKVKPGRNPSQGSSRGARSNEIEVH